MRAFGIAVAGLAVLAVAPPGAFGAPAAAALDSSKLTLTTTDSGWSTPVGVTNLTNRQLKFIARPLHAGCTPQVGDGTTFLPPAQHQTVTVSLPAVCKAGDGLKFELIARGGGVSQSFLVLASPTKTQTVFWSSLLSFLIALAVAAVAVAAVALMWLLRKRNWPETLTGLGATWSFKDSIVSNVTAAGGLVAVVLGSSDFLKAVLGSNAESAIAVATIAGAIALALVGVAGVIVLTLKKTGKKDIGATGLCAGYVLAFGGAGGQVWTVTLLVLDLKIGAAANAIVWTAAILTSLLLLAYAVRSLWDLLTQGTASQEIDPLQHPLPIEVVAAAVGIAANGQHVTHEEVEALLRQLEAPVAENGRPRRRAVELGWTVDPLAERSAMP